MLFLLRWKPRPWHPTGSQVAALGRVNPLHPNVGGEGDTFQWAEEGVLEGNGERFVK